VGLTVAVVGPCAAGKSTLVDALREAGFNARHVAQEHSYVPDMWQRIVHPDALIYLDVSYETARQRRFISGGPEWLVVQRRRLAHARQHCDLYIPTDRLTAEAVLAQVLDFLSGQEPRPSTPS
jgi:nicotinamide riboside kinase